MDIDKASVRLFKHPPVICKASDVAAFLQRQGLLKKQGEGAWIAEIWLDRFKAFMSVDACDKSGVEFNLSESSSADPATLAVRLSGDASSPGAAAAEIKQCNMSPCGLFAFSLLMGLEATNLAHELMPTKRIRPPYMLTWSCYAFFIGGLLQLLVGILEVFRNNVYGATAFMSFGSFWLANGLQLLIKSYFPTEIPEDYLGEDEWGHAIRTFYLAAFVAALGVQTLQINKVTTSLICLLFTKLVFAAFEESYTWCRWTTMVLTWAVSILAFFLFGMELTNEVYGYEVFNLLPWHDVDTQAFAAAGKSGAMVIPQYALELRTARVRTTRRGRDK